MKGKMELKKAVLLSTLLLQHIIFVKSESGLRIVDENVKSSSDSPGWNWETLNQRTPMDEEVSRLVSEAEERKIDTSTEPFTTSSDSTAQELSSLSSVNDTLFPLFVEDSKTNESLNNGTKNTVGRSSRVLDFDDLLTNDGSKREGRILNNKKGLSIQGFIPILSIGDDKLIEKNYEKKSEYQSFNNPYPSGTDAYVNVNTQSNKESYDSSIPSYSDYKESTRFPLKNNYYISQKVQTSSSKPNPYQTNYFSSQSNSFSPQSQVPYVDNSNPPASVYQSSVGYSPSSNVEEPTFLSSQNTYETSVQHPSASIKQHGYKHQASHSTKYSQLNNSGFQLNNDQRYSIKNYPSINRPSKSIDGNQEKYNYAASGYGKQSLSKENCVCVPFYLCRNGYIANYDGARLEDQAQLIDERSKFSGENLNLTELAEPEKDFENPQEKNKKRAVRSTANETYTPAYAEDIMSRFVPFFNRDGCGLLRTCCQVLPSPVAGSTIPSLHQGALGSQIIQQQIESYPGGAVQGIGQGFLGQDVTQHVPQGSFDISSLPGFDESQFQAFLQGQQIPPGTLAGGSYPGSVLPPNSLPDSSNIHNHPIPNLPSIAVPDVTHSQGLPFSPGGKPGYPNPIAPPATYPTCGKRNAFGIQGRVQDLQYHDDSAEFGEFPWQVAILRKIGPKDSLYVCGGALIESRWIVTAAHCVKKFNAGDLKVRLGEWDVNRDDEFYPYIEKYILEVHVHPRFFPGNLKNDIALLLLDSPVNLNTPHIAPACLPDLHDRFDGQRCWVSGWGKDAFGNNGKYQNVLRKVDMPIIGFKDCEIRLQHTRLGRAYRLYPGFLCAGGEPGKDACEGDGGSPLVCENQNGLWKVVGLVSWGIGCGQPGVPGIYVNVGHYKPWIDSFINRYG